MRTTISQDDNEMNQEQRDNLSQKGKQRWLEILKIAQYFNCSREEAIEKWSHLKGSEELAEIMANVPTYPDTHCPKCGGELRVRTGKCGPFLGCVHYPACDGSRNAIPEPPPTQPEQQNARELVDMALKFVEQVGGVIRAEKLLAIVKQLLET